MQCVNEPEWDVVFADKAVSRLTHYSPTNCASKDDDAHTQRLREKMNKNAPVMMKIINSVRSGFAKE